VYEHLYDTNFAEAPGVGTHYVVLAYRVALREPLLPVADAQHRDLRWWDVAALLDARDVHPYVKAYFSGGPTA
jgi:colanic acid biosynthesis protein WcaH